MAATICASASAAACRRPSMRPCAWPRASAACNAATFLALPPGVRKSQSKRYLLALMLTCRAPSVDELLLGAVLGDHDLAFLGQLLGEVDHLVLRIVDVLEADRAHGPHLVFKVFGSPGRHVGEEERAHRLRGAFEGAPERVLVDLAHESLHAARIELGEVLESEHELAD